MLVLSNADLSTSGVITIGSSSWNVLEYQTLIHQLLVGWNGSSPLTDGAGNKLSFTRADITCGGCSLKITFPLNALLQGGLHPTQTKCVNGAEDWSYTSIGGRPRDGALLAHILKADGAPLISKLKALTPHDALSTMIINTDTGLKVINAVATIPNLSGLAPKEAGGLPGNQYAYGLSIFWHYNGACYNDYPNWHKNSGQQTNQGYFCRETGAELVRPGRFGYEFIPDSGKLLSNSFFPLNITLNLPAGLPDAVAAGIQIEHPWTKIEWLCTATPSLRDYQQQVKAVNPAFDLGFRLNNCPGPYGKLGYNWCLPLAYGYITPQPFPYRTPQGFYGSRSVSSFAVGSYFIPEFYSVEGFLNEICYDYDLYDSTTAEYLTPFSPYFALETDGHIDPPNVCGTHLTGDGNLDAFLGSVSKDAGLHANSFQNAFNNIKRFCKNDNDFGTHAMYRTLCSSDFQMMIQDQYNLIYSDLISSLGGNFWGDSSSDLATTESVTPIAPTVTTTPVASVISTEFINWIQPPVYFKDIIQSQSSTVKTGKRNIFISQ